MVDIQIKLIKLELPKKHYLRKSHEGNNTLLEMKSRERMFYRLALLLAIVNPLMIASPANKRFLKTLKTEAPDTKIMDGDEWEAGKCKAVVKKQPIVTEGCETKYVKNRICYGRCNSIYIPPDFKHCKACIPSRWIKKTITFKCKRKNITDLGFQFKELTIIKECKCQDVECSKK